MVPNPKERKQNPPGATEGSDPEVSQPTADPPEENNLSGDEEEIDPDDAEFHSINNCLDALSSALDNIEQKNDSLHEQLLLLLESQRESLKALKEENSRKAAQQQGEPGEDGNDSNQPEPPAQPMEQC
ncbi:UPF0184 protein AAEL002161 [Anopheles aquasalis]|uniref:UPF0184 protein AAEL002161 n=1 Tax=Anopheles aquasalis TaxID=42839 RepID=UPI00215AAB2D|nr:UPF0184 protein AAEL002161 [Anopheles aquasalis]